VTLLVSAAADGAKTDTAAAMQAMRESTRVRILSELNDVQREQWEALANASPNEEEPLL
jgi:hypothetical protein